MAKTRSYKNYPCWIVLISNIVSLAIYATGAFVISRISLRIPWVGHILLASYLLFILWLEIRVMKKSCVGCCYFGKFCAFGKGKLASLFFRNEPSQKLADKKITWKDLFTDFLVSLIPLIVGIILLISDFNWLLLISIILLVILSSAGNGFVRGSLACRFCKQRELGCPAEQLFSKKGKVSKKGK